MFELATVRLHVDFRFQSPMEKKPAGLNEVSYDLIHNIDWNKYENAILDAFDSEQERPPE